MGISAILVALYLQPRVKSRKRWRAGHQHYTTQNIWETAVPVAEVARSKFLLLRIAGNGGSLRDNRRNDGHLRRGGLRWRPKKCLPFCQNTTNNGQEGAGAALLLQLKRESHHRKDKRRAQTEKRARRRADAVVRTRASMLDKLFGSL